MQRLCEIVLLRFRQEFGFDFFELCYQIGDELLTLTRSVETKVMELEPVQVLIGTGLCYFVLYPITVKIVKGTSWLVRLFVYRIPLRILKFTYAAIYMAVCVILTPISILYNTMVEPHVYRTWHKLNRRWLQQDGTISGKEWKVLKQYHKQYYIYRNKRKYKYRHHVSGDPTYNCYNWGREDFINRLQLRYRSSLFESVNYHKENHRKDMNRLIANHAGQLLSERADHQEKLQVFKSRQSQKISELEDFLLHNCNIDDDLILEVTRMCREIRVGTPE